MEARSFGTHTSASSTNTSWPPSSNTWPKTAKLKERKNRCTKNCRHVHTYSIRNEYSPCCVPFLSGNGFLRAVAVHKFLDLVTIFQLVVVNLKAPAAKAVSNLAFSRLHHRKGRLGQGLETLGSLCPKPNVFRIIRNFHKILIGRA
mmetsp:Transcript_3555/g.6736  ORF Transcript_3555/g.6736 Transcript_3555/m.6736 type:complete len:146 (+) Transcript_3555:925-1362(+)